MVIFQGVAHAQNMLAVAMEDPQAPGHFYQASGNSPDLGINAYPNGSNGNYASGCQNCNASDCGCQNGCCAHGCGANCGGCWPKWYVGGGAVFLWRDNRSVDRPVVTDGSQTTLIDTRSTDFDTGIGPQAMVGFRTSACTAWTLQYFSAFDFDGQAITFGSGNLATPGTLGTSPDFSAADQMSTDYSSDLHNVEFNHVRTCGCFSLIAGFRFVDLDENYDLTSLTGTSTSLYHIHTRNDLYGAQLGGRYRQCCHRFFWEFTGKAGVYGNDAEQNQFLTGVGTTESHQGTVAFVGDLNLSAGFQLCCAWAVRCGYNLMWIDQVALAPDQLNFDTTPSTNISTSGDVFLNGINVALEAHW